MKKRRFLFLSLIFSISLVLLVPIFYPESFLNPNKSVFGLGLTVTILIILTIAAFFFEFGFLVKNSKEIALISMLSTVSALLRIPFAAIPNLQPCTYLITCVGYVFGPTAGFMVGVLTALVSNFFLGQGPWTPYQMFAWGLIGSSAAILKRLNLGRKSLMIFGFVWGYGFGLIMNLWFWLFFIYPLTLESFLLTETRSFIFDSFHAVGNLIFLGLFGLKTIRILERFKKRFNIELINQSS